MAKAENHPTELNKEFSGLEAPLDFESEARRVLK